MTERNYKEENERQKNIYKDRHIKIPRYLSDTLDKKLEKENKSFTSLVIESIEKYLKKK